MHDFTSFYLGKHSQDEENMNDKKLITHIRQFGKKYVKLFARYSYDLI